MPFDQLTTLILGNTSAVSAADRGYLVDRATPLPGTTVDRYRIRQKLDHGGQAAVLQAYDTRQGGDVALKLVPEEMADRLASEIQVLKSLQAHANVVGLVDYGTANRFCYLALELLHGPNLEQLVQNSGPLEIGTACKHVRQAALGLQHVHDHGLIHNDVKPSNMMLAGAVVKVIDFGLAVPFADPGHHRGGTPDYMAPDWEEPPIDRRVDLYGLGGTLYYLLTAQVPFPGPNLAQKLADHRSAAPQPVQELRPSVPAKLAQVIDRLLAKRRENRFETAAQVAEILDPKNWGGRVK